MIDRSRRQRAAMVLAAVVLLALGSSVGAAEARYVDVWGPAVGSRLPLLDAPDHTGQRRTLGDLVGRAGLLLFLVRSADW